ncbi:MAG: hypothetical protein HXX14_07330 [Bacteroidetes bacterium]|nr:hypothetical protein [Bacteroidota bacterium]
MDKKSLFTLSSNKIANQANFKIIILSQLYQNNDKFINTFLESETDKKIEEINKFCILSNREEYQLDLIYPLIQDYNLSYATQDILSNYLLVACYSFYEKAFKEILAQTDKLSTNQLYNCYKEKYTKELLKSQFSIDFELLQDSAKINELLYFNNDIKHKGLVGKKLASVNDNLIVGNPFTNTYKDFRRLMGAPISLLEDLVCKIKPQL